MFRDSVPAPVPVTCGTSLTAVLRVAEAAALPPWVTCRLLPGVTLPFTDSVIRSEVSVKLPAVIEPPILIDVGVFEPLANVPLADMIRLLLPVLTEPKEVRPSLLMFKCPHLA